VTADNAGTPQLKQFLMVNIKTKFPRGINSDQVISARETADDARAPGPRPQAASIKLSNQPVQTSSDKPQALSNKRQASSHKQQAP
jgi:hypothetical protein